MARSSGYDNPGPLTPVGRVEPHKPLMITVDS